MAWLLSKATQAKALEIMAIDYMIDILGPFYGKDGDLWNMNDL